MFARYYGSSLGRFQRPDPGKDTDLADPQSWNKYAYVRSNPLRYTDPRGMMGQDDVELTGSRALRNMVPGNGPFLTPGMKDAVTAVEWSWQVYGNYGGYHWTGGEWYGTSFDKPPVDPLDAAYKKHDEAYTACESAADNASCRHEADDELIVDALRARLAMKNVHGQIHRAFAVAWFMAEGTWHDYWNLFGMGQGPAIAREKELKPIVKVRCSGGLC